MNVEIREAAAPDLPAIQQLWVAAWKAAMPQIDFEARRDWFARHCAALHASGSRTLVALANRAIVGFVMIDPVTGYLDQFAVAPERGGTGLAGELLRAAKKLAPAGIDLDVNTDNDRAIRFYEKHGFATIGHGINANSGRPVYKMSWRPKP